MTLRVSIFNSSHRGTPCGIKINLRNHLVSTYYTQRYISNHVEVTPLIYIEKTFPHGKRNTILEYFLLGDTVQSRMTPSRIEHHSSCLFIDVLKTSFSL